MTTPCEHISLYMRFTGKGITHGGFPAVLKADYLLLSLWDCEFVRGRNFMGDGSSPINCWDWISFTGIKYACSHKETISKPKNKF